MRADPRRESGQATVEYILLLAIIGGFFLALFGGVNGLNIMTLLKNQLGGDFTRAYQYGHPKARGYDDGGPVQHPRIPDGDGDIRLFYVKQG